MSYIRFSSDAGEARIGGSERARLGSLLEDIAWSLERRGRSFYGHGQPDEQQQRSRWAWGESFDGREKGFGERLGWPCLVGNDLLKLCAHVHGQCEIHGWVHPDDREWFADLIDQAFTAGLLSNDRVKPKGQYDSWPDVSALARRSTSPLVSEYSVTESWPNPQLIAQQCPDLWSAEDDEHGGLWDAWDALGEERQNEIADAAIDQCGPRWCPENWGVWSHIVHGRTPWERIEAERT